MCGGRGLSEPGYISCFFKPVAFTRQCFIDVLARFAHALLTFAFFLRFLNVSKKSIY